MRIAFVSDSIYPFNFGGKEKRLHDLSGALSRLGHDVHVYTMKWWPAPEKQIYLDGITFHALCGSSTLYGRENRKIWPAIKFSIACLKMIGQPWDVVDVDQMPFFPLFTMWIVAKIRRKKLFATWHESLELKDWVGYMGKLGVIAKAIEDLALLIPSALGTASGHTLDRLRSSQKRTGGIQLVGTGLDLDAINGAKPSEARLDVIYVGRLVKGKNINFLIDAMKDVLTQNPKAKCYIFGSGVERDALADQINILGLQESIYLKGTLPKADQIYSYIKSACVLVLPSDREGFGIVAAEALACGTPVVTVNAPNNAATSLVTHGVDGSIVDLESGALANAILYWLGVNKKIQTSDVFERFSWDSIVQRQLSLYQS